MLENFTMIDFNYFDVAIGSIVIILGIKGFLNGFIREIFGLAGLVGGVYLASRFAPLAADFIDQNFLHLKNVACSNL
jgi:membrane protein required for colicin V production